MSISASKSKLIEILAATEIKEASKEISFEGLEFDSREIRGGEIFIALPGENAHGNTFISTAFSRGAALVIADSGQELGLSEIELSQYQERILVVTDTLQAFWKLAAWWRSELNLPTLAITGSVGKTTVKEICASILIQSGSGCYSLKSHNNHVGVPYTICRSSKQHQWLIIEIGMNNRGEIRPLSLLVQPNVAVVTTIAPAHVGNLGSIDEIENEKLDIAAGLKSEGVLVLNAANPDLLKKVKLSQNQRLVCFGVSPAKPETLRDVRSLGLEGISFNVMIDEQYFQAKMSCLGRTNAQNAACAVVACKALFPDLQAEQIIAGLNRFTAPLMRLNLKQLSDGSRILDDSYNANPASMVAAIELIFDLAKASDAVILILGDMLELGDFSEEFHLQIAQIVAEYKPKSVIAVGKSASLYLKKLPQDSKCFMHFEKVSESLEFISKQRFDFALIKASRGIGLEQVTKFLLELRGEEQFSV